MKTEMSKDTKYPAPHVQAVGGLGEGEVVLHGRYRLQRPLGRGGMGAVWLAEDLELHGEFRALKFVPDMVVGDSEEMEILKGETAQSQKLTHKNIVRIYDFVRDPAHAAIAMEYIDGPTLKQARAAKTERFFEVDEIRDWVGQMLGALHYAHTEAGVVHHDLKPANLMLTRTGQLKVTDFGISQAIGATISRVSRLAADSGSGGTSVSGGTSAGGTPAYMSPQQVMGGEVATTDDIYSLGATLHELLTGRPPFYRGEILTQLLHKVAPTIDEARAELDRSGAQVPKAWQDTIRACLEKKPTKRPQSVAEVAQRLGYDGYTVPPPGSTKGSPAASSRSQKYAALRDEAALPDPFADDHERGGGKKIAILGIGVVAVLVAAGFVIKALFVPLGDDVSPGDISQDDPSDQGTLQPPEPDPLELALARAQDALTTGRYGDAVAAYDEILLVQPDNVAARLGRAESAVLAGQFQTTVNDVSHIELVAPEDIDSAALRLRAAAHQELGQTQEAIADYSRAVEMLPPLEDGPPLSSEEETWRASLFQQRGGLYLFLNDNEAAIADFESAVKSDLYNAIVYLDLAEARLRLRQFREAKLDATEAMSLNPDLADAYHFRGTANFYLGLYNEALADLNQALAIDPDYTQAAELKKDTEDALKRRSLPPPKEEERGFWRKLFNR
ncbi:hypothetical protein BH23VER1_BH23VER1_36070 [soil metagenome]